MGKQALKLPALCLVTDPGRPNLEAAVKLALSAGVTMLQLRGHACPTGQLYALANALRSACQEHQAAFLVNDRLDIGLAVGADGFQLGARSFPLAEARRLAGADALLGASVHSVAEARAACTNGADFLLAGTIFPSRSHPGEVGRGPALLTAIKQALPSCPLLAIGGITSANAGEVRAAGADGIAVISAIFDAEDIPRAVRELRQALSSARERS